jgi:hypothetical protein
LWAVNAAGDGAVVTANSTTTLSTAPVPNPPQNVTVTPGYKQLSIAYTSPVANGGPGILGYKYSLNSLTEYVPVLLADASSPIVVTGLTDGTSYIVRFVAYNSLGNSTVVLASAVTTYSAPAAPVNIVATTGYKQISISFTPPSGSVDGYKYSIDSGGNYTTLAGGSSPIVITGLNDSTTYTVYLKAYNNIGEGVVGYSNSVTTYGLPSSPQNVIATAGFRQISIAFTAPINNGGATIIGYKYSFDGINYTNVNNTISPIVVTGLDDDTIYTVRLKAFTSIGDGTVATASSVTTSNVLPTVPRNVVITPGDRQLSINFTVPGSAGASPIIGYKYSLDGGEFITPDSADIPIVISSLIKDQLYIVRLRAFSSLGDGSIYVSNPIAPIGKINGYYSTGYYYNDILSPMPQVDSPRAPHQALNDSTWYMYDSGGNVTGYPEPNTVYSTWAPSGYNSATPVAPSDSQWNGAQQYYIYVEGVPSLAVGHYSNGYYSSDGRLASSFGIYLAQDAGQYCYYSYNGEYQPVVPLIGLSPWTGGFYYVFHKTGNTCDEPFLAQGFFQVPPDYFVYDFGAGTKNPILVTGYHKLNVWYDYGEGTSNPVIVTGTIPWTAGVYYNFGSGTADPAVMTGLGTISGSTFLLDFYSGTSSPASPSGLKLYAGYWRLFTGGSVDLSNQSTIPAGLYGLVNAEGSYYFFNETSKVAADGPQLYNNQWVLFNNAVYQFVLEGVYGDYMYYGNDNRTPADGPHADGSLWYNGREEAAATTTISGLITETGQICSLLIYSLTNTSRVWIVGSANCTGGWFVSGSFVYNGTIYYLSFGAIVGSEPA